MAIRGAYCGDPRDGRRLVDEARRALGTAAVDTFVRMHVPAMAAISMDPLQPIGALGHSELLRDLSPGLVDTLVELGGPGSPLVMLELRQLGGALAGPVGALSPMAHTGASYSLNGIGLTPTPDHAVALRAHLRELASAVRPYATGDTYLNFLDLNSATPQRVRAAYSEGRLVPPGPAQGPLRPGQPLPLQPQHPTHHEGAPR